MGGTCDPQLEGAQARAALAATSLDPLAVQRRRAGRSQGMVRRRRVRTHCAHPHARRPRVLVGASARHERAYIAPPWTRRGCRITRLGPPAGGSVLSSCSLCDAVAGVGRASGAKAAGAHRGHQREPGADWRGARCMPRGRGRRPRAVARSLAREDHTTTPRWRARARIVLSRRERPVSRIGQKKEKSTTCEPSTLRRSAWSRPTRRPSLGVHVVASPGSHGALEGGGLSVRSFSGDNSREQFKYFFCAPYAHIL